MFEDEGMMYIDISDHGIGIPEDHMGRIFERFYQVDGSLARNYGGNGLGLFLARNIVDVHKGNIWVESTMGAGTIVHIQIPLYDPAIHSDVPFSAC